MIKECYVGVKGIVHCDNQCLLLRKGIGEDAFWDVPGGRINDNETLEQTLQRELREELPGIKNFSMGALVGAYRIDRDLSDGHALVLIFYEVETEKFEIALSSEHDDYRWFSSENLPELLDSSIMINPALYAIIEKVLVASV